METAPDPLKCSTSLARVKRERIPNIQHEGESGGSGGSVKVVQRAPAAALAPHGR